MTNEQTALAKVIKIFREKQELYRKEYKRNGDKNWEVLYKETTMNISILTEYLPTEREQIVKSYHSGFCDAVSKEDYEIKYSVLGTPITNATDYFNQNYTQDGK